MKVSFVIPVLNSEATLGECLDAIHAQKVPDGVSFEIVIADAGSSDRTLEIARAAKVEVITTNPLKTGEAGKTAAEGQGACAVPRIRPQVFGGGGDAFLICHIFIPPV